MGKKIIAICLLLFAVGFFFPSMGNHKSIEQQIFPPSPITKNIVEKNLVIKALSQKAEWVGLEGEISKTFSFTDISINTNYDVINNFGKRESTYLLNGKFKLGFDMAEVTPDKIVIRDETILIISPKIKLIVLDIPYDSVQISYKMGMLRNPQSDFEKQMIYSTCKTKIAQDILADRELTAKATKLTQDGIVKFLMTIPNAKSVKFI